MTAILPDDTSGHDAGQRVFFDAILHPHRSLSPKGFAIFMGVFSAISLTADGFSVAFKLLGNASCLLGSTQEVILMDGPQR